MYVCRWERARKINKETDNVSFTSSCETTDLLLNLWKGAALVYLHLFSV